MVVGSKKNWNDVTIRCGISLTICAFVKTQYHNVTDRQTDRQTDKVGWCLMAHSAQIGYIVPWTFPIYCLVLGQTNNDTNNKQKYTHFNLVFVKIISLTHKQCHQPITWQVLITK